MNNSMTEQRSTRLEKIDRLAEKYKELFKVELKNIYFSKKKKEELTIFMEHSIESLSFLYLMWHVHDHIDPKLYRGMTKKSVWFFMHGMLLQRFVASEWQPEMASTVAESIVVYIVSQAVDLFGIRAGITKIN